MSRNKVAEALGLDTRETSQVPLQLMSHAFYSKLAERGYEPRNEQEGEQLWNIGLWQARLQDQRQQKQAQSPQDTLLSRASTIAGLAASESVQQSGQGLVAEAVGKTAEYLQDPTLFAHGLASLVESDD